MDQCDDADVSPNERRYHALIAHWLSTDPVFARAYALIGPRSVRLTCFGEDPTIFPEWEAEEVRAALGIADDAAWWVSTIELERRGWLVRSSYGGDFPGDDESQDDFYDITCNAPAIVWLAERS